MAEFFAELAIVMMFAFVVSFLMQKIKQPLIIGYILTGILAGPIFFDILSSNDGYKAFSEIGVALLLFIVGLHLNLKLIKEVGFVAFAAGIIQISLTIGLSLLITNFLVIDFLAAFIVSIAIAFSSTIVIVKTLTDNKQMEKVHGKITLGILIVQDLVAVAMIMILNSIAGSSGDGNLVFEIIKTFIIGIIALFIILAFSKYILERFIDKIALSQELLYLFVIAWCLIISIIFLSLGFSVEIGALVAGVALASSPFQHQISSKVKPLRDFFIVMFFILLGSQMIPVSEGYENVAVLKDGHGIETLPYDVFNNFKNASEYIAINFAEILIPSLVLSVFVLISKPLILFIALNLLRFHSKVGFSVGMNLSQISEFSLILAIVAFELNLIDQNIVSMLTLVAIITITISTYFITNTKKMYKKMNKMIGIFEFRKPKRDNEERIKEKSEILVFGYDKVGYSLLKSMDNLGKKYTIIDYNPDVIHDLNDRGVDCVFGDASDIELVNDFDLESCELLISTIPDFETNLFLLKEFKKRNHDARVILTASDVHSSLDLYEYGADYVILPTYIGGSHVSNLLDKYKNDYHRFFDHKISDMNELKKQAKYEKERGKNRKKSKKKK